jgi:crotonobetainyl-CoA:carnitine CoA-transferase CaiB-like acyl-CoA transferase
MLTPHRRPYATRDGHICVICVSDEQWRRVFGAIGRPELIDDPRFASVTARAENVDALYGVLTEAMRARATAEWLAILTPLDIPCGAAASLPELLESEYLRKTGFFEWREHPVEGAVTVTAIPAAFSDTPGSVSRLWPTLGEHTAEVLHEAGLSEAEIRAVEGENRRVGTVPTG